MTQVHSLYHQRSPRYILLPQENCLIHIAGPKQVPWEEGTEIKNISSTGLCFTAPEILAPKHGEYIKIQLDIPGSQVMACHGKVSRVEKIDSDTLLVGIEFEALSEFQRRNLFRGLKGKKFQDDVSTMEMGEVKKVPRWMYGLFLISVTLSLYLSAYLLFALFHFLSNPQWIDKITQIVKLIFNVAV
jgi:hypothetical protein